MNKRQQLKNVKLVNYLQDCLCNDDYTNNNDLFNYQYNLYIETINKTPMLKNRIRLSIYNKTMKPIKQSVINTFNRVGIPYQELMAITKPQRAINRFTGEGKETTALLSYLVKWIYNTNNEYEDGKMTVNLSDFDRIKYFILDQDSELYSLCID